MADKGKNGNWFGKHKILTAILVVIVLAIIGGAAGGSKNTNNTQASKAAAPDKTTSTTSASTQQAATKPAPQPQTLLDLTGSGTKQTQQFTAAGNWDLTWSYDCTNFGGQGNFIVTVYNKDGSESLDNSPVNQLGASGNDVQHYYKSGTYYLSIDSECSWHVIVAG